MACEQRDQIARHRRGFGKGDAGEPGARRRAARLGRVRQSGEPVRQRDRQLVGRLEHRLIPAGEHAARIGHLELGDQHALAPAAGLVVVAIDAVRRLRDRAGIGDVQPVSAGRQRCAQGKRRGLRLLVLGHLGMLAGVQRRAGDRQPRLVEHDVIGRLAHLDRHVLGRAEGGAFEVRHDVDRIGNGQDGLRQLARRAVQGKRFAARSSGQSAEGGGGQQRLQRYSSPRDGRISKHVPCSPACRGGVRCHAASKAIGGSNRAMRDNQRCVTRSARTGRRVMQRGRMTRRGKTPPAVSG